MRWCTTSMNVSAMLARRCFIPNPSRRMPSNKRSPCEELVADMKSDRVEVRWFQHWRESGLYGAGGPGVFRRTLRRFRCEYTRASTTTRPPRCRHWHIPESHCFERWGDVRAYDGTTSIIQPLINPLYQIQSSYELLSALLGDPSRSGYEIVRATGRRSTRDGLCIDFGRDRCSKGLIRSL